MEISTIGGLIYIVRGQRVMLDSDLARLYGVATGNLNKSVRRNNARFPPDFMFQLTDREWEHLIFQTGISSKGRGGSRFLPHVFTEHGVAMLSSVLASDRAVRVNIKIIRTFVSLRRALVANKGLAERIGKAEKQLRTHGVTLEEHANSIRSVFEEIRRLMREPEGPRRRIGF